MARGGVLHELPLAGADRGHGGFTPKVWEQEVTKMIEDYGAPIPEDSAKRVVAYLKRNYSGRPAPAAGTSSAPGTD